MCGGCVEGVRRVHGGCMEGAWRVRARCVGCELVQEMIVARV
jgi:hypothetical protein